MRIRLLGGAPVASRASAQTAEPGLPVPSLRAKRSNPGPHMTPWIASSLSLLAMTTTSAATSVHQALVHAAFALIRTRVIRIREALGAAAGGGCLTLADRRVAAGDVVGTFAVDLHADRIIRVVGLSLERRGGRDRSDCQDHSNQYAHRGFLRASGVEIVERVGSNVRSRSR